MVDNPQRRTAMVALFIALLAGIMIFVPELVGIDGFEGGFAISFFSLFILIMAIITAAIYLSFANKVEKILRGEGLLAHWIYPADYWMDYAKKEYTTEKSEKKGLFLIVTGFALFFGVLFWVLDPEAGFYVFLMMIALIGIVAFAWRFSAWHTYHQNMTGPKEVYITKNAIYLNQRLYTWQTVLTSFDEATQENNQGLPLIVFRYTATTRAGPQTYITRVPIPKGQEETAKKIVKAINQEN